MTMEEPIENEFEGSMRTRMVTALKKAEIVIEKLEKKENDVFGDSQLRQGPNKSPVNKPASFADFLSKRKSLGDRKTTLEEEMSQAYRDYKK